ncbi:MAG: hypothetical protein MUD08_13090, partial [Cytophagales bacterium]|nr:hypothetical protein [Cytophagales bacterium]
KCNFSNFNIDNLYNINFLFAIKRTVCNLHDASKARLHLNGHLASHHSFPLPTASSITLLTQPANRSHSWVELQTSQPMCAVVASSHPV